MSTIPAQLSEITAAAVGLDAQLLAACQEQEKRLPALLRVADREARPVVAELARHTNDMHSVIADTAVMAERISRKVRLLDRDQQRVRRVLALLDDLSEVRDSAAEVTRAMAAKDWELASIHVQRFLKHDIVRIRRVFDKYKPLDLHKHVPPQLQITTPVSPPQQPSELHDFNYLTQSDPTDLFCPAGAPDPIDTLIEAKKSLCLTITSEFDNSVSAGDEQSIIRFFKLFAVVGEPAMGLDKFGGVLAGVVKRLSQDLMRAVSEADRVPTLFADLFTRLFESVASLIDKQEMIIERHYGPGRLLRIISKLQKEVDVQTAIMMDSFEEKRMISRKIADINTLDMASNKPTQTAAVIQLDPREVDALVNEIALISSRTRLFIRFLEVRSKGEEEKLAAIQDDGDLVTAATPRTPTVVTLKPTLPIDAAAVAVTSRPVELEGVAFNPNSGLSRRVMELMSNFATLQEFFLKKSIEKAIKLDEYETGSQISSCVGDVFYIVRTSMLRTLSTCDSLTICTVLESVGRILETEYVSVFQKRLAAGNMGALETKENKTSALIALNNLDTSCDYIQTLVKEINAEIDRSFAQASAAELDRMKTCLARLTDYGVSFKKTLMIWVENIFNQMIKPKIKPTIVDICKDLKYVLSDAEYVEADAQDTFIKRFIRDFGKLIAIYKSTYSPRNHNQNISYFIETILSDWERHLFASQRFNALGALRFDKDLRSVTTYLTSLTNWSIRDKFVRLNNMAALLNVEGLGEVAEVMGVSAGWRLSAADVTKCLGLRVDFGAADIAQLKLQ
ncbi:Golgi transport complex subunit 4 [Podochytrium sp. JEL0797]|nr:Golgi transport complex subunit 4 [Podochytrium sp. JEL0797]